MTTSHSTALRPGEIQAADISPLRASGVRDKAIRDAIYVCVLFSTLNRISDTLDFKILPSRKLARAWKLLSKFERRRVVATDASGRPMSKVEAP